MIKKEQNPPKLLSIPHGGQYHTIILPEKEPWYIIWLANVISTGSVLTFVGYIIYLASIS